MTELIVRLLKEFAGFYNEMAVYLLFGFLIAAIMNVVFPESFIRRHLSGKSMHSVFKSTLFGIPLPLCSCGVVPVAAALRKSGASKGATAAFLTATPQIGADSFLITYSLLGGVFALFRIAASLITALIVGAWVNLFHRREKEEAGSFSADASGAALPGLSRSGKIASFFRYVEYDLLGSLANPLMAGILIAGVIAMAVPEGFFAEYLHNSFISMLVMLLIGIPMYVCASASTPIAASLIYKGISPGAALVFLLTGPATNAVTIAAVFRMLGKKAAAAYLAGIALVALLLGFLLDLWVLNVGIAKVIPPHHTATLPGWLKLSGSAALGLMLAWYYFQTKILSRIKEKQAQSAAMEIPVTGMTCLHCAARVKQAVESVQGASDVIVDIKKNTVRFELKNREKIGDVEEAVRQAGYDVPDKKRF